MAFAEASRTTVQAKASFAPSSEGVAIDKGRSRVKRQLVQPGKDRLTEFGASLLLHQAGARAVPLMSAPRAKTPWCRLP